MWTCMQNSKQNIQQANTQVGPELLSTGISESSVIVLGTSGENMPTKVVVY